MSKEATINTKTVAKSALLEAGMRVMIEKGYSNTSIQEVLDATNVPKGSFYYYFDSKEDFAMQIIDYFLATCDQLMDKCFDNKKLAPIERLKLYCQEKKTMLENDNCRKGCLIGNLSQEMSDQSEVLRARLEEALTKLRNRLARCIKEGQEKGEINANMDHIQLAEFFQCGLHGAVMRAKTTKTISPLDSFFNIIFEQVLKP